MARNEKDLKANAAAHEGELATLQRRLEVTERGWKTSREMRKEARWPLAKRSQNATLQRLIQRHSMEQHEKK